MITLKDSLPAGAESKKAELSIDNEHKLDCHYHKDPHTGDVIVEVEDPDDVPHKHPLVLTLHDHDRQGNTTEYRGSFDERGLWVAS